MNQVTDQALLRRLQLTLLEILKVVDLFCRERNIQYSLYAGTLLGAVRHKGFIPWDDDVDICMSRKEYNRFLAAWQENHPKGYLLQNKENTPAFTQSFSKIRKEHTTFIQDDREIGAYHTGAFIDIFPIDRMPNGTIKRAFFTWDCMRYQLLTREFIPPKGSFAERMVSSVVLRTTPKSKRQEKRNRLLKKITKNNDNPKKHTVAIETVRTITMELPETLLDDYCDLQFEDGYFMCVSRWNEYLRIKFGNYMQFPPENERTWAHHPIVLDFEHDYEELLEEG